MKQLSLQLSPGWYQSGDVWSFREIELDEPFKGGKRQHKMFNRLLPIPSDIKAFTSYKDNTQMTEEKPKYMRCFSSLPPVTWNFMFLGMTT